MDSISIVLLIGLIIVLIFIAIGFKYLCKILSKILELIEEQNKLIRISAKNKKEKASSTKKIDESTKTSNELKSFIAKEITVKKKHRKKTERFSMEQWKKMKKIYGEDTYDIIEYHG